MLYENKKILQRKSYNKILIIIFLTAQSFN